MRKNSATIAACGIVWASVLVLSLFSPDLVSGSEHEHLPLAAMTAWLWGIVASGYLVLLAIAKRDDRTQVSTWKGLTVLVGVIWLFAAVASIAGPQLVTGSDPTELPLAALLAPPAAALATAMACIFVATTTAATASPVQSAIS